MIIKNLYFICIFVAIFCIFIQISDSKKRDSNGSEFGVIITSIPSRQDTIAHSIRTWLSQSPLRVKKIVICIPRIYKNYDLKRKLESNPHQKFSETSRDKDWLEVFVYMMIKHFRSEIYSGLIEVAPIQKDFGPASKWMGLLQHLQYTRHFRTEENGIKYWIIADDDVGYSFDLISKYSLSFSLPEHTKNNIYTMFSQDQRMSIRLENNTRIVNHNSEDGETREGLRAITHLQGVDTFVLSTDWVREQQGVSDASDGHNKYGPLYYPRLYTLLDFFHEICPDSFYQDDYLVSFIMHIAGARVVSLWNEDSEATVMHIEGVSKSHDQMHLHPQVLEREQNTKECITLNSGIAVDILLGRSVEH